MSNIANQLEVRAALREGMARLGEARVASHALAAELLLMHVLGRERAWLYAHPEERVGASEAARYFDLVARRASGVPVQYLTGRQEFWGLEFEVTPEVLIPRPETEHVVEVALERLGQPLSTHAAPLRIADVGTGSGCLAVALARELPEAHVVATDISFAALALARRNAARHGIGSRIEVVQCNLLDACGCSPPFFHVIVSNPPYVGLSEAASLPREVAEHEPGVALFGGDQGLEVCASLLRQAEKLLAPGGALVVEMGHNALEGVRPLFGAAAWTRVAVTSDLAGIPRVIAAERC